MKNERVVGIRTKCRQTATVSKNTARTNILLKKNNEYENFFNNDPILFRKVLKHPPCQEISINIFVGQIKQEMRE